MNTSGLIGEVIGAIILFVLIAGVVVLLVVFCIRRRYYHTANLPMEPND